MRGSVYFLQYKRVMTQLVRNSRVGLAGARRTIPVTQIKPVQLARVHLTSADTALVNSPRVQMKENHLSDDSGLTSGATDELGGSRMASER